MSLTPATAVPAAISVRNRRRVGRKDGFTCFMVNQQGTWAATGDMTIPKCRSAIPPGQALGSTAGRLLLLIDSGQNLAYLRGQDVVRPD